MGEECQPEGKISDILHSGWYLDTAASVSPALVCSNSCWFMCRRAYIVWYSVYYLPFMDFIYVSHVFFFFMCSIVKLWILLPFSQRHLTDDVTSPKTRCCRVFGFVCRVHTQVHVCFVHMCLHGTPVLLCLQWPRDVTSFHVTVACAHMLLCLSTSLEVSEIDRRIKHTRLVSSHVQCVYTNTEADIVLGCMSTEHKRLWGKFWLDVVSTKFSSLYRKHKLHTGNTSILAYWKRK